MLQSNLAANMTGEAEADDFGSISISVLRHVSLILVDKEYAIDNDSLSRFKQYSS